MGDPVATFVPMGLAPCPCVGVVKRGYDPCAVFARPSDGARVLLCIDDQMWVSYDIPRGYALLVPGTDPLGPASRRIDFSLDDHPDHPMRNPRIAASVRALFA